MDLRTAHSAYENRAQTVRLALQLFSERDIVANAFSNRRNLGALHKVLEQRRAEMNLDFLSLCDQTGKVVMRAHVPFKDHDPVNSYPLILQALQGVPVYGTVILTKEQLELEGGEKLAARAVVQILPTSRARPSDRDKETCGMCLMSAVPVKNARHQVLGAMYGGILLNRNYDLVDRIREIAFEEQFYKGRELGTVTIFQWDVRISTNVLKDDGQRAIGTRVSDEVYRQVIENQKPWFERAFVVHDWYLSAYEPIFDPEEKVIGILYVGILENKYTDLRNRILSSFLLPLIIGIVVVLLLSFILASSMSRPLRNLVIGTQQLTKGDLDYRIKDGANYLEFEQLKNRFNQMAQALKEREEALNKTNTELLQINRNYMEILGFVSHEMKNALANMLGSAYNLRDGIVGALTAAQKSMTHILIRNIERLRDMIKNYLDLSRIEKGELEARKQLIDFKNHVLVPVFDEIDGPLKTKGMQIDLNVPASFEVNADPDLLKIIMENLLTNAIKYGKNSGKIQITAAKNSSYSRISVWNEGEGIPEEELPHLFSKFKRLNTEKSRREKGSGLGLFITKEMVEKQGGKIWVESEKGQWAEFIFKLPDKS